MLRLVLFCLLSVRRRLTTWTVCLLLASLPLAGCAPQPSTVQTSGQPAADAPATGRAEDLFVVDCLLPGQVRKLGRQLTYLTPRRPIKTSARDCEIRGGEYVAYDRSDYATALKVWLPQAQEGDQEAQTYVGEIYEKGLGVPPDYAVAAAWYRKAAEQGDSRAQINLGHLYEKGLGVEKDPVKALAWYRKASGLSAAAVTLDAGSLPWPAPGPDVQQELQTLRQEVERWRSEATALQQQLEQTQQQLDQTRQELERRQRGLETERRQLQQSRQELERRRQQLDVAATRDDAESRRLEAQLKQRVAELERQQQDMIRTQQAERRRLQQSQQELERQKQQLAVATTRDDAESRRLEAQLKQRVAELERQQQDMIRTQQAERHRLQQSQQELEGQKQQLAVAAAHDDAEIQRLEVQLKQRAAELERRQQDVTRLQQEKARLEDEANRHRVQLTKLEQQQQQVAGPTIEMIDPPVTETRGLAVINVASDIVGQQREIVGRVTSPAGLLALTVNDRQERIDDKGLFHMSIPMRGNNVPVKVVAIDKQGKRTSVEFQLRAARGPVPAVPKPEVFPNLQIGTYYALVIGNQTYQHWPSLRTPEHDATTMANTLDKKYGFKVELLLNATRFDVLQALNELRKKLTEKDNLLIYYAGHGQWEEKIQRGYWVPVDGDLDSNVNWISTVAITDILSAMSARHVLVIADSCYSGALTRSALARLEAGMSDEARRHWLRAMVAKRSRTVLSSGALEPVLDSGGGQHSVFAKAFLDVLDANSEILVGQQLYSQVAARVTYAAEALAVEQNPQYAPIRYAGHEAGDFILVPTALQ